MLRAYDDVLKTALNAKIDSASSTTTQSANNEDSGQATSLLFTRFDRLLHVSHKGLLVLVRLHSRQRLVLAVHELPAPRKECQSCSGVASMLRDGSAPMHQFR